MQGPLLHALHRGGRDSWQAPVVTVTCYLWLPLRFGTQTADVPGQQGDRVTVVGAPGAGRGRRAVLSAGPPGMRPGEPMALTNHLTGANHQQGRGLRGRAW